MSEKQILNIVKIGGNVIDNPEALESFLDKLSKMPRPFILVHGGGALATKLSQKLGVEVKMVEGRRVTDTQMIKIATMVYAGLINKKITALLQRRKLNAIGLSGADAACITSKKREDKNIDWGYVGDVTSVNASFIESLLNIYAIPVFCAITYGEKGELLNTNADTVASALAKAMAQIYREKYEVRLIYCFEKEGVMENPEDTTSLIKKLDKKSFLSLKQKGTVAKGMTPKLENAFAALEGGVAQVVVKQADNLLNDIQTLLTL